jgi:hypothetical protein
MLDLFTNNKEDISFAESPKALTAAGQIRRAGCAVPRQRDTDFNCRYAANLRAASPVDYRSIADFLVLKT